MSLSINSRAQSRQGIKSEINIFPTESDSVHVRRFEVSTIPQSRRSEYTQQPISQLLSTSLPSHTLFWHQAPSQEESNVPINPNEYSQCNLVSWARLCALGHYKQPHADNPTWDDLIAPAVLSSPTSSSFVVPLFSLFYTESLNDTRLFQYGA